MFPPRLLFAGLGLILGRDSQVLSEGTGDLTASSKGISVAEEAYEKVPQDTQPEPTDLFGARRRSTGGFSFSPRRRTSWTSSPRRRTPMSSPSNGPPSYEHPGFGESRSGQTVSHKSAADIMREKIDGAMLGFVLFVLGFPVLWFNEQRQAKMEELFIRAARVARTDVDSGKVDPQYERCLVHMKGETQTSEQLQDKVLDASIKVTNCAHLKSSTEMLQWVQYTKEEEKDDNWGGKETVTSYSYSREWMDQRVDSSSFNDPSYENPIPPCVLGDRLQTATSVKFGAFNLPDGLVRGLCNWTDCSADATLSGPGSVGGGQYTPPAVEAGPRGKLPPGISQPMAEGFLAALRREYVEGMEGAVGSFFDSLEGVSAEAGQLMESIEGGVQQGGPSAAAATISSLSSEWGLAYGMQPSSAPVSSTGLRPMGEYLTTGSGDDVGDLRVSFKKVPCGAATILAVQSGNSFEPMEHAAEVSSDGKVARGSGLQEPLNPGAQNIGIDFDENGASFSGGCCMCCQACGTVGALIESGESVFQIQEAHVSAKEILQQAADAQSCCHMVGKYGGWFMMVIGLNMIFSPFPSLFRFIPFAGTYIQTFVGWITGFIAFLLGSACAALTVAFAWMYARPSKSVQYLLIAFALIAGIYAIAGMYSKEPNPSF